MKDGGSAFPGFSETTGHGSAKRSGFGEWENYVPGMTYRQWLIGMALSAMVLEPDYSRGPCNANIVERAITIADRIIEALEKEGK